MPTARSEPETFSEAAVFARAWESAEGGLSPELARHLAKVGFSARDKERMHELAVKNQEGKLTARERREFDGFIKIGDLLAILRSKARKVLAPRRPRRNADE